MTTTTFFIIFIPFLAMLLLSINLLLAPHNPYQEKDSTFECGFHSFLGQNRTQFSISFFIFALLFLLFDLEILLVYPYSVSGYNCDIYGLIIMMIFFILLTLGFIFELGKNALSIDSKQTVSYGNEQNPQSFIYIPKLLFENLYNQLSVLHSGFLLFNVFKGFLFYVKKTLLFVINNKDAIFFIYVLSIVIGNLLNYLFTNIENMTIYCEFLKGYMNLIEQQQYMYAEQDFTDMPNNGSRGEPNNDGLVLHDERKKTNTNGTCINGTSNTNGTSINGTSNTNGTSINGTSNTNGTSVNDSTICPDRAGQPHVWIKDDAAIGNSFKCSVNPSHPAYHGTNPSYYYCPACASYRCNNCQ